MYKRTFATLLTIACIAHPSVSLAAPLSAYRAADANSLSQWAALNDADKAATVNAFIIKSESTTQAAPRNQGSISSCLKEDAADPQFKGFDFATAFKACLIKLGLN